jgi:alanyl-tRNA synthetase
MQAEIREQKKAIVGLQGDIAGCRAAELAAAAELVQLTSETPGAVQLVARVIEGDANSLNALAKAIVARPGYLAILVSSSTPVLAVVARSADIQVPAQRLVASLTTTFGGRGGGKPDLAQAGGLTGSPESVLAAARALL